MKKLDQIKQAKILTLGSVNSEIFSPNGSLAALQEKGVLPEPEWISVSGLASYLAIVMAYQKTKKINIRTFTQNLISNSYPFPLIDINWVDILRFSYRGWMIQDRGQITRLLVEEPLRMIDALDRTFGQLYEETGCHIAIAINDYNNGRLHYLSDLISPNLSLYQGLEAAFIPHSLYRPKKLILPPLYQERLYFTALSNANPVDAFLPDCSSFALRNYTLNYNVKIPSIDENNFLGIGNVRDDFVIDLTTYIFGKNIFALKDGKLTKTKINLIQYFHIINRSGYQTQFDKLTDKILQNYILMDDPQDNNNTNVYLTPEAMQRSFEFGYNFTLNYLKE